MPARHLRVAQRGLGHRVGEPRRQSKGGARPLRAPRPKRPPDTSDRPGRKKRGRAQKRKGKARRAARDAPGAPLSAPYAPQDPNVPPTRQTGQGGETGASEEEKGESGVMITRNSLPSASEQPAPSVQNQFRAHPPSPTSDATNASIPHTYALRVTEVHNEGDSKDSRAYARTVERI